MDNLSRLLGELEEIYDIVIDDLAFLLERNSDSGDFDPGWEDDDEDDEDNDDDENQQKDYSLTFDSAGSRIVYRDPAKQKTKKDYASSFRLVQTDNAYKGHEKETFEREQGRPDRQAKATNTRNTEIDANRREGAYQATASKSTPNSFRVVYDNATAAFNNYHVSEVFKVANVSFSGNDVINIEYKGPHSINGQLTYQRVVLQADRPGETVYDLTVRKLSGAGIQTASKYDREFDSVLFTSINKKQEGAEGNFNEFYLNGDIGSSAADKAVLKKGDTIEWRYAKETDGKCGGSPDFNQIKAMAQYSSIAKAQANFLGLLNGQEMYQTQPNGFYGI